MVPDSVLEQYLHWRPVPESYAYLFPALPAILPAINRLFKSSKWEDVLEDPYLLINTSFETWQELIDDSAWKLLDLSRKAEKVSLPSISSCRQEAF